MKKICIFLIIIQIIIISACSKYETPPGRDTVEIYGDGRFQILRGGLHPKGLSNVETNDIIEPNVRKYKEIKPLVYIIGVRGYTILNYETEEVQNYEKLEEIPDDDKKVFEELDKK